MKRSLCIALVSLLCAAAGAAPVTVTVQHASGFAIPENFAGISFETGAERPNHNHVPGLLFFADNKQLIQLFTNTGIRTLRVGGGTVDTLKAYHPTHSDIDGLFGFAKATDVKVIYSLHLLNGNPESDADDARYIWTHYQPLVSYFAIGNEPNEPPYSRTPVEPLKNYEAYLPAWRKFAAAVTAAVPDAKFVGPDSGGWDYVERFAHDEVSSGLVKVITFHQYSGGSPNMMRDHMRVPIPAEIAIHDMLSGQWVEQKYLPFYQRSLVRIAPTGLPGRMTEANDYLGGIYGASNAFSSALWALDYMHWWAAHGLSGIDFHNNEWLTTDTFYIDSDGNYQINPKAYAIRAFDIGSHGQVQPVTIANPEGANVTAYAVRDAKDLYVTMINRSYGDGARPAALTIVASDGAASHAEAMFLIAPNNDPAAMKGVTLGGDTITNDRAWDGKWTELKIDGNGHCAVSLPAASAAVVKISLGGSGGDAH